MRKQRPRGTTTREAVVNAALSVADRLGLEALTIRGVAEEVSAPPMSLYVHFANKSQLLDLMYAEVARRMYKDENLPTWQAELFDLCHRIRGVLTEHPNWAPLLSRPAPPMGVPMRERVLALMVADGMADSQAFKALSGTVLTAIGFSLAELTMRMPDGKSALTHRFDLMKKTLDAMPEGEHARTRSAMNALQHFNAGDAFTLAIGALINGLSGLLLKAAPEDSVPDSFGAPS